MTDNTMQITHLKISTLKGYERNARTHSDKQVAQIADSIREFGFNNPILVDETHTVIAGHGRLAAACALNLDEAPCIVLSHLTDAQRRAYILADNKIALNSGWDKNLLIQELSSLRDIIDLATLGFADQEILELLPMEAKEGNADPDNAPDLPENPTTLLGDVWLLGNHRLMCGDSVDKNNWRALVGGDQLSWVWLDPPYNVNYGDKASSLNKAQKGHRNCDKILNDHMHSDQFLSFLQGVFFAVFDVMSPGASIYVAHSETERANFTLSFLQAGFKLSSNIIWRKNQLVLGRADWQYIHEPILYGWKPGAAHHWAGGRKNVTIQELPESVGASQAENGNWLIPAGDDMIVINPDSVVSVHPTSILSVNKPQKNDVHPTMKPVELVERCLRFSAKPGSIGGDAFGGSGTTLTAAERLGLSSRLMEQSPKYCDVIVERWQKYTGKTALHAATGKPFTKKTPS